MTRKIRRVDVEKYAYYINKLRQNVCLERWLWRQIWRHKQRTPNTNDHHVTLNENPPCKFSAYATAGVLQRKYFADAQLTLRYALFLRFIPVMGRSSWSFNSPTAINKHQIVAIFSQFFKRGVASIYRHIQVFEPLQFSGHYSHISQTVRRDALVRRFNFPRASHKSPFS